MGKPSDWEMSFKTGMFDDDQTRVLKNYGIDKSKYKNAHTKNGMEARYGGFEGIRKDLLAAANNDYDTRRTIEAANRAGIEGAKDYTKGFETVDDVVGAHNFLAEQAKNYLGTNKLDSTHEFRNPW